MWSDEEFDEKIEYLENTMKEINRLIDEKEAKLVKKEKPITEKKNHQFHIIMEKSLIEKLKREAKDQKLSLVEYCRRKLRGESQLDRIERKVDKILNIGTLEKV